MMTASPVEHRHSSGHPFYLVTCEACGAVLNGGHHYNDERDARRTASEHNAVEHRRYTRSEWTVSGDLAVTFYENGEPIWSERYDSTDDAAEDVDYWCAR